MARLFGCVLSNSGSAYIIAADETISGYSTVNCMAITRHYLEYRSQSIVTTSATGLTSPGTVSISSTGSSNDTSAVGKLLASTPGSNAAVAFEDTGSTSGVTDQWNFFGAMLTYQSTQATFQAVPTDTDMIYQIYWVADAGSAPTGGIPVVLKRTAPASPARPVNGGGIGNAEMRKKMKKRSAIAAH